MKKQRRNTETRSARQDPQAKPGTHGRMPQSFTGVETTDEDNSLKNTESESVRKPLRNPSLTSLSWDHHPRSSPTSSFSSSQSTDYTHYKPASLTDSVQQTSCYEHSSMEVQDKEKKSGTVHSAMEAIHDEHVSGRLPDVVGSILPSHRFYDDVHLMDGSQEEDEENHTIGSVSSSLKRNSLSFTNSRRPSSTSPPPIMQSARPPSSPGCPTPPPSSFSQTKQRHVHTAFHKQVNSSDQKQSDDTDGAMVARKRLSLSKHQATTITGPRWQSWLKTILYRAVSLIHWLVSWMVFIIHRGMEPLSKSDSLSLLKEQQRKAPFTNALFCLGSEASKRHCARLWACERDTQLALLVLSGAGLERFLWRELRVVMYDDTNWMRSLYVLRHTLWPGGKFIKSSNRKFTESEVDLLKRKAADSFKKFLPSKWSLTNYKIFLLRILELLQISSLTLWVSRTMTRRWFTVWIVWATPELTGKGWSFSLFLFFKRLKNYQFRRYWSGIVCLLPNCLLLN